MNILGLDISTSTGWCVFNICLDTKKYQLINCGNFCLKNKDISYTEYNQKSLIAMLNSLFYFYKYILDLIKEYNINEVVIEQTNKSKNRFSQKMLEWLQLMAIFSINKAINKYPHYLDSSEWRSLVDLRMSKEDKKHNRQIKISKKRGKITKKHLSVRIANSLFNNLKLKIKDNDIADALLLGMAFIKKQYAITTRNQ